MRRSSPRPSSPRAAPCRRSRSRGWRAHIGVPHRFESVDQVVKFVLIAALGCTIAPTFALLPLATFYEMPLEDLVGNWSTWWQGDASGVLIFAPLILSWFARSTVAGRRAGWSRWRCSPSSSSAPPTSCSGAGCAHFPHRAFRRVGGIPLRAARGHQRGRRGVRHGPLVLAGAGGPLPASRHTNRSCCCCSSSPRWCSPAWC